MPFLLLSSPRAAPPGVCMSHPHTPVRSLNKGTSPKSPLLAPYPEQLHSWSRLSFKPHRSPVSPGPPGKRQQDGIRNAKCYPGRPEGTGIGWGSWPAAGKVCSGVKGRRQGRKRDKPGTNRSFPSMGSVPLLVSPLCSVTGEK